MSAPDLHADYSVHEPRARAFLSEFTHQFSTLLSSNGISLGVPIEGRVKEWKNFSEKLDRKEITLQSCTELPDFIGVRAITLFRRDVDKLCRLVEKTFRVREKKDKATELGSEHFGYLSRHFVVSLPRSWRKIPAFTGLDYTIELQIRTLSQHIWAAASHKLQYKKERDVPPEVARSIHRVAALLETVDLEFERVLDERESYKKSPTAMSSEKALDIENLKLVLDQALPPKNRTGTENYSELLNDLNTFGINTVEKLRGLVGEHLPAVIEKDKRRVEERRRAKQYLGTTKERIEAGVFYNHAGLTRALIEQRIGSPNWRAHIAKRAGRALTPPERSQK